MTESVDTARYLTVDVVETALTPGYRELSALYFKLLMKRMIDSICESVRTPEYTGIPASTFS